MSRDDKTSPYTCVKGIIKDGQKKTALCFFANRGGTANFLIQIRPRTGLFYQWACSGFIIFYEKGDYYGTFNPSNKRDRRRSAGR